MKSFYINKKNCYMANITLTGDVVIPEIFNYQGERYHVVGIDFPGFEGCKELISISVPDSVTYIAEGAFSKCANLRSINLGQGIEVIPEYLFYRCNKLEKLHLPDSVKEIQQYSIYKCRDLRELNMPEQLKTIRQFSLSISRNCTINFPGTIKQWDKLNKEASWDLSPYGCEVQCADGRIIEDY